MKSLTKIQNCLLQIFKINSLFLNTDLVEIITTCLLLSSDNHLRFRAGSFSNLQFSLCHQGYSVKTSVLWQVLAENNSKTRWFPLATAAKSLQSCPTLWGPIDGRPPGSPVPGILQARTLEGAAISFSTQLPQNYPNLFHHLHSFLFSVDADGNKLKKMEG